MGASRSLGNIGDTLTEFGRLPLDLVATGTPTANNYLSGDGTWKSVALTNIDANNITTGTLNISRIGSGTANNHSYLSGNGSWNSTNNFAQLTSSQTFSAKQLFSSTNDLNIKLSNLVETANVIATAVPSVVNYNIINQSVLFYTANSTSNCTVNLRGSSTKTFDSVVANGECVTIVLVTTNGITPYTANVLQIDGITITPKWQGGTRAAGSANSVDSYIYSTIKTSNNNYIVLASLTKYS
nr:MAG: hypothetical protein [Caudoviricetes sp.]